MIAALNYLSQLIEGLFVSQMRRAAVRIHSRQQLFPRRAG
jgi:hypothetical protein